MATFLRHLILIQGLALFLWQAHQFILDVFTVHPGCLALTKKTLGSQMEAVLGKSIPGSEFDIFDNGPCGWTQAIQHWFAEAHLILVKVRRYAVDMVSSGVLSSS